MFIESIILTNYRAYKGVNKAEFHSNGKNIFLIAGNNGFGKTTFLTSLVWCLYGKLMADVDDKFRREINDVQGYKNYAKQSLNKELATQVNATKISLEEKKVIAKKGYSPEMSHLKDISQYSIEICLSDVFIPSIPCSTITINRTYDYLLDQEFSEVLIDGQVNELAKEVGYDIFINDFILSKDIAKFFFFDAEKIVNLAEVKSIDEKRRLSSAYSEVLGIKKYEDIKKNLENLRLKFRRSAGSTASRAKLDKLSTEVSAIESKMQSQEEARKFIDGQIQELRAEREVLQERLIREGNAISVDELDKLKELCVVLKEKDGALKNKLRDMLDIAPFAISGGLFLKLKEQIDSEKAAKANIANSSAINNVLDVTQQQLIARLARLDLKGSQADLLQKVVSDVFNANISQNQQNPDGTNKVILDYTSNEDNEFQALYDNIKYSYSTLFKQLVKDVKNNSIFLAKTQKKISAAEYDDGNTEILATRTRKAEVEEQLLQLELQSRNMSEDIGTLGKDLVVRKKQLSELAKTVRVDDSDKDKDIIAERLITELSRFLFRLRVKRKVSLEKKIKNEIDMLMHKADFIHSVKIELQEDIIEILLLDKDKIEISKEKLSKGEQQLYATAILKSLVDESGIAFPVFIDSPLQKFDSIHSRNIITKFYPTVSKQVVIFPLLGKELSRDEYNALLPNVNSAYIIANNDGLSSLMPVTPSKLFDNIA